MKKIYNSKAIALLISVAFLLGASVFVFPVKGTQGPKTSQTVDLKIIVSDQQKPGVDGIIADFLADPLGAGVDTVTVVASGTRSNDQLAYTVSLMEAQDDEFDVIGLDTIWPAQFAENGWIEDLNAMGVTTAEMDDYVPGMVDSGMYKGTLWAYPYFMNLGILFYRNDLLSAEGFTEADFDTWAELNDTANYILNNVSGNLVNPDLVGYVGQFDAYEGGVVNFFEWAGSNGVTDLVTSTGSVNINNPDVATAMDFVKALIPPQYTGVQGTDFIIPRTGLVDDEGSSVGRWLANNSIFMRQWTFAYGLSVDNNMDFGVTALPTFTGAPDEKSSAVGGAVLAVSHYSTHKTDALNFIRFLGDQVAQEYEFTSISNFPALKSVYTSPPTGYEWIQDWSSQLDRTLARPVHPKYSQISTVIADYFSDLLSCNKEVSVALEEMEADVKDILGGAPSGGIPGFGLAIIALAAVSMITIILVSYRRKFKLE
ncbi:MAG: extracellular solute-binding protein [Candidatus Thorarchaeota archaeon]